MLKVDKGYAEIRGTKIDLMAEFTMLVHGLLQDETFTEDDLELCINTAKKSSEDVAKEAKEAEKKLHEMLKDDSTSPLLDLLMSMLVK